MDGVNEQSKPSGEGPGLARSIAAQLLAPAAVGVCTGACVAGLVGGVEHALLHLGAVDTDGAAADLVAVQDEVVGVGERGARVLVEGVGELRLRRGERVVHRRPADLLAPVVLDRLEDRRVDDPDEVPRRLVDQAAAAVILQGALDTERTTGRPPGRTVQAEA